MLKLINHLNDDFLKGHIKNCKLSFSINGPKGMFVELIYIFIMLCYGLILFTGVFLLIRMIRTKLKNLFGLANLITKKIPRFFNAFTLHCQNHLDKYSLFN
jgi:hypothetical protein